MVQTQSYVTRNHGVDLLKNISMIMVVVLHLNMFGGLNEAARLSESILFKISVNLYEQISIIAVNVFVIISSYFLSSNTSQKLKSKRILNLIISMFFWYFVCVSVVFVFGGWMGFRELIISLPIVGTSYDFIAGYLVLYFLSPYINKLTHLLSYRSYRKLAMGLFILFCLLGPFIWNGYLGIRGGYSFAWFICIFIIVGFLKEHVKYNKWSGNIYITIFLLLTLVGALSRSFIPYLYVSRGYYNDPIIFCSSLALFFYFLSLDIGNKQCVKILSFSVPLSVAVFFIHANPFVEQLFRTIKFENFINNNVVLYLITIPILAFSVFCVSIFLEYLRVCFFIILGFAKVTDKWAAYIDRYLVF